MSQISESWTAAPKRVSSNFSRTIRFTFRQIILGKGMNTYPASNAVVLRDGFEIK